MDSRGEGKSDKERRASGVKQPKERPSGEVGLQLGKGREAMDVSVPESSAEESCSPKRRRGEGKPPAPAGTEGKGFDWDMFRHLLQDHKAQIIEANRAHADDLFRGLEAKCEDRFQLMDKRQDSMEERAKQVDARLDRLEGLLRAGVGDADATLDSKRRYTLVIGGWNQDTQKRVILGEIEEAVKRLDIGALLDSAPFTTGARRSVALVYFDPRRGEADSERRSRMHEVLQAITRAKAVTSHGKRMWVSFSKSKQERDISGHCGWVKRSLASFGQGVVDRLDVDYASGTSWYGDFMVASSSRNPPDGADDSDLLRDTKKAQAPWVHVGLLAKATGISQIDLKSALEEFRR